MADKLCTKCGQTKQVTDFALDRTKIDGLATQCKECKRAYMKQKRSDSAYLEREHAQQRSRRQRIKAQLADELDAALARIAELESLLEARDK